MNKKFNDLSGKTFGNLLVLSRAEDYVFANGRKEIGYLCSCSCGTSPFRVMAQGLRSGHTKSCGCENIRLAKERTFQDLVGYTFGDLKVVSLERKIKYPSGGVSFYWTCLCSCGNNISVSSSNLRSDHVKSCGCKTNIKESNVAKRLKQYFMTHYAGEAEYKAFKNKETNQWLRFDIFIESKKAYIEIHGLQHYVFNGYFFKTKSEFENRLKLDKMKKNFARKNGIYIEVDLRVFTKPEKAIEYVEKILL